jgi:hypothetical protein
MSRIMKYQCDAFCKFFLFLPQSFLQFYAHTINHSLSKFNQCLFPLQLILKLLPTRFRLLFHQK